MPAVIHGIVTDIDTGNPIPDATVYRIREPGLLQCVGSYLHGLYGTYRIYASRATTAAVGFRHRGGGLTYRLNVALSKCRQKAKANSPAR